MSADSDNNRFFVQAEKAGHHMFDLGGYCAFQMFRAGLNEVYALGMDTYSNEEDFFSYRRKTHRGEPDYGRQISAIMIKSSV